jgi:hypothetical protein
MEDFSKNKKIAMASAVIALVACFMPFVSFMGLSVTVMGAIEHAAEALFFPVTAVVAMFFLYKNNFKLARISFLVTLLVIIYSSFLKDGAPADKIFDVAGIGFYLILFSSISGVLFSKE